MLFLVQEQNRKDGMFLETTMIRNSVPDSHLIVINPNELSRVMDIVCPTDELVVPVGTIEFVSNILKLRYKIERMNPIEIPPVLRRPEFLLRDYKILPYKDIPKEEYRFLKSAETLKKPIFIGTVRKTETMFSEMELVQSSEVLDIISEYRVTVHDGKIIGIHCYDGNCTVLPDSKAIHKIKQMIARYCVAKDVPKCYTMDVAIVNHKGALDLALLEIHPFTACGIYGILFGNLAEMTRDGFLWYLDYNTMPIRTID